MMFEKQEKKQKQWFLMISFLLCLIPRLLFLIKVYPMSITGDESFMFMPAASWAGLDWSGNAENYRYYGYGFVALLTPFFKLVDDPVLLYRIFVSFMILFQALAGPIAYHIANKYFALKNSAAALFLSVSCSYLVFVRAVYVYNEFVYDLVVWLIFWCMLVLLRQQEQKGKKAFYTVLLMVLLTYEMTIHSRGVTLWLALGVTIVFFIWVYRTCIVSIPAMAVTGIAGYILSKKGIDYIVQMFTNVVSSGDVSNTEVSFSILSNFSSAKSGMGWFFIVLGQINSMVLVTGGIAIIGFVWGCRVLWDALLRRKKIVEAGETGRNYVLVLTYGLAASAITILGQSFSWLPGVAGSIEMNETTDAMRAVTYLRYYGTYFVPVLFVSLIWVIKNKEQFRKMFRPLVVSLMGLQVFWVVFVIPYITGYNGTSWEFNPFSLTNGWEDTIRIRTYLPAVAVAILFFLLFFYLTVREKTTVGLLLLSGLLFYTYGFNSLYHEGQRGEINYSYMNRSYELYQVLQEQKALPEKIHVEDFYFPETGQSLVSEAQFILKNEGIVPELPDVTVKEGIFITCDAREKKELFQQGFLFSQIDENEYWYVKGEKIQRSLEEAGVRFTPCVKQESVIGLNQFLSDVKVTGNGFAYMDSTGEEGYFLYGYEIPFSEGTIEFSLDMQLFSYDTEDIGTFELWKDGSLVEEIEVESIGTDEQGNLSFTCQWEGTAKETMEPRLYLNPGTCLRITEASYKR